MHGVMLRAIDSALAATAVIGAIALVVHSRPSVPDTEPIERIAELPIRGLDGSSVVLPDGGVPTLYMVVSPRCPVSIDVMPYWKKISDAATAAGYRVVALGLDDDAPEDVVRFLHDWSMAVELRFVAAKDLTRFAGVAMTPTVIIVDEAGATAALGLGLIESNAILESTFGVPAPPLNL